MTGPYEHRVGSRQVEVLRGKIELDGGDLKVEATVLGGTAEIEIIEEYDDMITAWGMSNPVRYLNPRRRLRLTVDCAMDQTILSTTPPDGKATPV